MSNSCAPQEHGQSQREATQTKLPASSRGEWRSSEFTCELLGRDGDVQEVMARPKNNTCESALSNVRKAVASAGEDGRQVV
jgi:hypothetical protein